MVTITSLHGTAAAILICALLFIDECGVPLPFAPNEVLLIFAGLLMGSGDLSPFFFYPLALLVMGAGMWVAYSWARALGATKLRTVAKTVRATKAFDRATRRVNASGPLKIGITRMLPGVRIYATLVSGAAEVSPATFLTGALPALVAWTILCTGLGIVVGAPAAHFLAGLQQLAFSGGILLALGFASYAAARHIPAAEQHPESPLHVVPKPANLVLALGLDLGIITTILAGIDQITRFVLDTKTTNFGYEVLILGTAIAIAYIAISRRGAGATVGERLFDVTYQKVTLPVVGKPHHPDNPPSSNSPASNKESLRP